MAKLSIKKRFPYKVKIIDNIWIPLSDGCKLAAKIFKPNIPTNKKINIALTYIFGIGPKRASNICIKASIDQAKRVNQLNDDEVTKIRELIEDKSFSHNSRNWVT